MAFKLSKPEKILVSFDWSSNTGGVGGIHMKMGLFFDEKSSFKMLGLTLFLN